jgi:hypothetical protein
MLDEFTCQAKVTFRGKVLALNRIVANIYLEDIMPSNIPLFDPSEYVSTLHRAERRKRFVDFVAAEFAQALTQAIFDTKE